MKNKNTNNFYYATDDSSDNFKVGERLGVNWLQREKQNQNNTTEKTETNQVSDLISYKVFESVDQVKEWKGLTLLDINYYYGFKLPYVADPCDWAKDLNKHLTSAKILVTKVLKTLDIANALEGIKVDLFTDWVELNENGDPFLNMERVKACGVFESLDSFAPSSNRYESNNQYYRAVTFFIYLVEYIALNFLDILKRTERIKGRTSPQMVEVLAMLMINPLTFLANMSRLGEYSDRKRFEGSSWWANHAGNWLGWYNGAERYEIANYENLKGLGGYHFDHVVAIEYIVKNFMKSLELIDINLDTFNKKIEKGRKLTLSEWNEIKKSASKTAEKIKKMERIEENADTYNLFTYKYARYYGRLWGHGENEQGPTWLKN